MEDQGAKEEKRWTVEMAIPLVTLGKVPEVGSEWGVNFLRSHTAYHMLSIWSNPRGPVWDDAAGFGKMVFVGPDGKKPASQEALRPPESLARLAIAMPTTTPPGRDGSLAEQPWRTSLKHTGFVASDTFSAKIPRQTEAYYLYDDQNLYMGLRCYADKNKVQLADVASLFEGECVETFWDTAFDRKNHYQLIVGPTGLQFQAKKTGDLGGIDMNWKGPWSVTTSWEDKAWTARMIVPFQTIGAVGPQADKLWGHTVIRNDTEHKCHSCFSPVVGIENAHATDRYGFLYFQAAGRPAPVLPLELRFQPGLPRSDPDLRVPWGDGLAWLRVANLAGEDRDVGIALNVAGKHITQVKLKMKSGEDRFVPLPAHFDKVGEQVLKAVVKADGGKHALSASIEVLPIVTARLASPLYFTAGTEYLATIKLNSENRALRDQEFFLGVRPAHDQVYRKQERLGRLKTGAVKVRLGLGDLPAGDYVLDTGMVSEGRRRQPMSSFPFQLRKTPYDF